MSQTPKPNTNITQLNNKQQDQTTQNQTTQNQTQTAHPSSKTQQKQSPNTQTQTQTQPQSHNKQQQEQITQKQVKAQAIKIDQQQLHDLQIQKFVQDIPQKANQQKQKGNQLFKVGKYSDAILQYQKGLKYTNDKNLRATLFSNMVISFMKDQDYDYAKKYCKKVLKQDQNHKKGRMNLARCYQHDGKIQQAYEQYKKLDQNHQGASQVDIKFIKQKLTQLKPKVDEINQKRQKQVVDGLKNIGNSILGYFGMSLDNFKLEQGAGGGYNISFKQ